MNNLPTIMILGKVPPPYMGPSIATEILLNSELKNRFRLIHVDTKVNANLNDIGKWSIKKFKSYFEIWTLMISKTKKYNPNLVLIPISQSTIGFLKDSIFIIIASLFKKKILLHLRGSDFRNWFEKSNKLNKWYVKNCLKLTKGVIVLGENLKPIFKGLYSENKIFVAPNGGDYKIPSRTNNNEIPRILYLGNLQSSKGIEDVIEAIAILKQLNQVKYEVEIIGGWRNEATKQKCLQMILENNLPIHFTPPELSKNKLQELSNADIFVFPPRAPEGHPWVIVEAMAAGLPIISTDKGAIIESVHHDLNGYIIASSDPKSMAQKISELIKNPELRLKMGRESRKRYEENFTEKIMVKNLTSIFNTILETK